ncbi:MAG: hypothetical protein JO060_09795 [Candidatus Eremiobacteraeota bacterium]|nr:hypothetical protein [Candidatus Eremiobacteraeota bacterium]
MEAFVEAAALAADAAADAPRENADGTFASVAFGVTETALAPRELAANG